jgi:hypothetical protein
MRSLNQIYDEIIAEKENLSVLQGLYLPTEAGVSNTQKLLNDLSSNSKVAIWRLWAWVTAVIIWTHETLWEKFKAEIIAILDGRVNYGHPKWFRQEVLNYQHGHELIWDGKKYRYAAPLPPEEGIIQQCAVVEAEDEYGRLNVTIKVVKAENEPLEPDEKSAFTAYVRAIKPAGIKTFIKSNVADDLKLSWDIYYDPLVLNADGELITDTSIKPVEVAIDSFLKQLPFNGMLVLTRLVDAVQNAEGVADPVLNSAEAKYGANAYEVINARYLPDAGHLKVEELTINYIANV